MTRPVVHVLDPIHPDAIAFLREHVDLRLPGEGDWQREAEAVIVRNSSIGARDIADSRSLRVIGKHGAGTDNIDMEAARSAGIEVHATPGVNAGSVADLAVAMALELLRNMRGHLAGLRSGRPLAGAQRIGFELSEVPAGILGFGAIGQAVAKRLSAFDCPVRAFDPLVPDDAWPTAVSRAASARQLLESSRLIFVHLPLTPETRHLIDEASLSAMPHGSFLVNCARGGIVDEAALAAALQDGRLSGAASDVFETEPPGADHPLLALPNFIATPHIGASTNAGLARVGLAIAHKVAERLSARERAPFEGQ